MRYLQGLPVLVSRAEEQFFQIVVRATGTEEFIVVLVPT